MLGHLTTLTVSLLALPVARNGLWDAAFGIPFERAVRYHRGLGWLTWGSVTAHMLAWWIKWAKVNKINDLDQIRSSPKDITK